MVFSLWNLKKMAAKVTSCFSIFPRGDVTIQRFPNTEHVILSKEFVFSLFLINACECTCRRWNFKVSIPKGIITWSALGEQNAAAKVSYLSLSKGGQFGAVVAWSLFPNREWIPGIFILQKCQFMGIAVITVEPADKISFVYNCMETRLRGQTMGNDPLASFVCQDRW